MSTIPETLTEYKNHQGVLDKFCKTASYAGSFLQACGLVNQVAALAPAAAFLKKFGSVREVFWCMSTVRDLPMLKDLFSSDPNNPKRGDFKTAYLLSFRVRFVARFYLKLFNWVRPSPALQGILAGLGKLAPAYILTFAGYSLYHTILKSQREELGVQDYLSGTDDIAELLCTALEGQYLPMVGPNPCEKLFACSTCVSAGAGFVSGAASFLNRSIDVYRFHTQKREEPSFSGSVSKTESSATLAESSGA